MAYPTVSSPYGLVPVKMVDGSPYNGAQRAYMIESGNSTPIYQGDLVAIASDGYLDRASAGDTASYIGVLVGVSYTDPMYGLTFRNNYPGGVAADDITAYVVDGHNLLYKVAVVDASGDIAGLPQSAVGKNVGLDDQSPVGNSATGRSYVGVDSASAATTSARPLRVVQGVNETKNGSGDYTEVLVKFNTGHQLSNTTGV